MDIESYGWVNKKSDIVSWENGLKWISKAIVADKNPQDKLELKSILDVHLNKAFSSNQTRIKEIAVFFCLAWRKYSLLNSFWEKTKFQVMKGYLTNSLNKIFSHHDFKYLDFSIFIKNDKMKAIESIEFILDKKIIHPFYKEDVTMGLFSKKQKNVIHTFNVLAELFHKVNLKPDFLKDDLIVFLNQSFMEFDRNIENSEFDKCIYFLGLIEPLREVIISFKYDLSIHLRRLYYKTSKEFLNEVYIYVFKWKAIYIARKFLIHAEGGRIDLIVAEAISTYFNNANFPIKTAHDMILFIKTTSRVQLYELLCDISAGELNSKGLISFFEGKLRSDNNEDQLNALKFINILLNTLGISSSKIEKLIYNFFESLWNKTVAFHDHKKWYKALEFLKEIEDETQLPYITQEFLSPLIREALFSHSSLIIKDVLIFSSKYGKVEREIKQWLSERFNQKLLSDDLFSKDTKTQINTLNRLVSIYYRVSVSSEYLVKRLEEFKTLYSDLNKLLPDLKNKIEKAVNGLMGKLK